MDADDDGSPSPLLDTALAERAAGGASAADVLDALAVSRLLVPVVAVLEEAEIDASGSPREKQSSMATVMVEHEGQRALLAFTGLDRLQTWRSGARPAPMPSPLAARAALDEQASLYIDAAGPIPFAVEQYELLALAAVARPTSAELATDPVLQLALRRHFVGRPWINRACLESNADRPATLTLLTDGASEDLAAVFKDVSRDQVVRRLLGPLRLGSASARLPPGVEVYRRG
jgi:hypothetical protein